MALRRSESGRRVSSTASVVAALLFAVASLSCRKALLQQICDGPGELPSSDAPCPPGTAVSRAGCVECRYCQRPDGTIHGPFTTWYMERIHISDIPTENGGLRGEDMGYGRTYPATAGWVDDGRLHGVYARWHRDGTRALRAVYCHGELSKGQEVQRWPHEPSSAEAEKGWLTPPPGRVSASRLP
jgi:hypothetical protein